MTATDCLELRARLAEHAVSTLPETERRQVERHLEWCAGCRKEARELQEGAALAGRSLAPVEPPGELEDRVVSLVQREVTRGRPGRRRMYLRRGVTVLAAVIGLLGLSLSGILLANKQSADSAARASRLQAREYQQKLAALLEDFRRGGVPGRIGQVVLKPAGGSHAVGGVIRETPPHSSDLADELAVLVAGLDASHAPYRVWLVGTGGQKFLIPGYMPLDSVGGGQLLWTGRGLERFAIVQVRDARGRIVLSGRFRA